MMYILLPVIVISAYIGNILGCLVLCETIPELNKAKKFVWEVPIINFLYIMHILFSAKKMGKRLRALLVYLKTPCKNILIVDAIVETEKNFALEKKKSNNRRSSKHTTRVLIFRNSIEEYGRTIVAGFTNI